MSGSLEASPLAFESGKRRKRFLSELDRPSPLGSKVWHISPQRGLVGEGWRVGYTGAYMKSTTILVNADHSHPRTLAAVTDRCVYRTLSGGHGWLRRSGRGDFVEPPAQRQSIDQSPDVAIKWSDAPTLA